MLRTAPRIQPPERVANLDAGIPTTVTAQNPRLSTCRSKAGSRHFSAPGPRTSRSEGNQRSNFRICVPSFPHHDRQSKQAALSLVRESGRSCFWLRSSDQGTARPPERKYAKQLTCLGTRPSPRSRSDLVVDSTKTAMESAADQSRPHFEPVRSSESTTLESSSLQAQAGRYWQSALQGSGRPTTRSAANRFPPPEMKLNLSDST